MSEEPRLVEVSSNIRKGARLQMIKFELTSDYSIGQTEKWEIPEDWPEDLAKELHARRTQALNEEVDRLAQLEFDQLMEQRKELNG